MIKEQLNTLKTNIENTKDKLYTNLSNKGVTTITTASTLDEMADSVNNITVGGSSEGGNSFECIGYPSNPQYIQDGIDYAQVIYDNWDVNTHSLRAKFDNDKQLVYFPLLDTTNLTDMKSVVTNCTNLLYFPSINTSNVTDMGQMFSGCTSLKQVDLSGWNTSKVTSMNCMFSGCSGLTSLDLSSFDTSKVKFISYDMFYNDRGMFSECTNLSSITFGDKWDLSLIEDVSGTFYNCQKLTSLDLSKWKISNITSTQLMFLQCFNLTSITFGDNFNTSNVTNMYRMFSNCHKLTSLDLSSFNTSNVTNMGQMFQNCYKLTSLDLSSFNTSKVTNMINMFTGSSGLTSLDVSGWDTSNVTNMGQMFSGCTSLTQVDLSGWNTSKVTNMGQMFGNCHKLQKIDGYIDWTKISSYPQTFITSNSTNGYPLRYMTIKNLGTTGSTFNFGDGNIQNWGDESDTTTYPLSIGARQSLIDSLITYSYDRAANGLSTCTIKLYSTIKARLTEDEIAAITAKGFTIA